MATINDLNSVLIEGNVVNIISDSNGYAGSITENTIVFIETRRTYKLDDELITENYQFEIQANGKQADFVNAYIKRHDKMRVIGQLRQMPRGDHHAYVMAEHIECPAARKIGSAACA